MPLRFPYLSNFLGQEPDEKKKPQKDDPRLNLPPEVLQSLIFDLTDPLNVELKGETAKRLGLKPLTGFADEEDRQPQPEPAFHDCKISLCQ